MNRYGMNVFTLGKVCKLLQRKTRVKVEGLYSHLYANRREVAEEQRQRFLQMQRVAKGYFPQIKCHLSATYGALLGKAFCFDMVRIGIGLYGYLPNADTQEAAYALLGLLPAMKVEAKLVQNRVYSYGGAGYESLQKQFSLTKGERLAVCRAGYADGFLRSGEWLGEGETLLGNLCMDCMLLKTEKRQGQTVVLMQDAAVVAKRQGTIPYEILCSVTKRAEKVYIR
jgi:alanine racemase